MVTPSGFSRHSTALDHSLQITQDIWPDAKFLPSTGRSLSLHRGKGSWFSTWAASNLHTATFSPLIIVSTYANTFLSLPSRSKTLAEGSTGCDFVNMRRSDPDLTRRISPRHD